MYYDALHHMTPHVSNQHAPVLGQSADVSMAAANSNISLCEACKGPAMMVALTIGISEYSQYQMKIFLVSVCFFIIFQ